MVPFVIKIDTREKCPLVFPPEDYFTTEVDTIHTGDYTIAGMEDKICVERKASVSELAQNIIQKRFINEIERMGPFKHKCLLLEFDGDDIMKYPVGSDIPKRLWSRIRIDHGLILSKLSEFQIVHNIHVLFAGDPENAAILTLRLFKKIWQNERSKENKS